MLPKRARASQRLRQKNKQPLLMRVTRPIGQKLMGLLGFIGPMGLMGPIRLMGQWDLWGHISPRCSWAMELGFPDFVVCGNILDKLIGAVFVVDAAAVMLHPVANYKPLHP